MQLPPDVVRQAIEEHLVAGTILCLVADRTLLDDTAVSAKAKYAVAVRVSGDACYCLFTTSQADYFNRHPYALHDTVVIEAGEYACFAVRTFIQASNEKKLSISEKMISAYQRGQLKFVGHLSEAHLQTLRERIRDSFQLPPAVKGLLLG